MHQELVRREHSILAKEAGLKEWEDRLFRLMEANHVNPDSNQTLDKEPRRESATADLIP